jgi:hypothetical protein
MQFRPRFNQSLLPLRQGARNYLDRLDAEDPHFLLIICVKVRNMMLPAHLREHPNDNAEKPAEFRHELILQPDGWNRQFRNSTAREDPQTPAEFFIPASKLIWPSGFYLRQKNYLFDQMSARP